VLTSKLTKYHRDTTDRERLACWLLDELDMLRLELGQIAIRELDPDMSEAKDSERIYGVIGPISCAVSFPFEKLVNRSCSHKI